MKVFLSLVALAVIAYAVYRRTPKTIGLAVGLVAAAYECDSYFPYDTLVSMLVAFAFFGGVTFFVVKRTAWARDRVGQLESKAAVGDAKAARLSDDDVQAMKVVVGRVLSSRNDTQVLHNFSVSTDYNGKVSGSSSNELLASHQTWLYDLAEDKEVLYASEGHLAVRPGHVIGVVRWRGHSLVNWNISTNTRFVNPGPVVNVATSIVVAGASVIFGWALYPVMMLIVPFRALSKTETNGLVIQGNWPGAKACDVVMVLCGLVVYGAFLGGVGASMMSKSPEIFFTSVGAAFAAYYALHVYLTKRMARNFKALVAKGSEKLAALYASLEPKLAAQQAQQAAQVAQAPAEANPA